VPDDQHVLLVGRCLAAQEDVRGVGLADVGVQGQAARSQVEPGDVAVAIDRAASGQQQRGGEPPSLAVRGNSQRSVGGSAVDVET